MNKREREIEAYARKLIGLRGGVMYKWVSPGQKGVPDDVVVWPTGNDLVEFKSDGGRLSESQQEVKKDIEAAGGTVFLLYSEADVDAYVHYSTVGRLLSAVRRAVR
jgi:hypothetical protein